MLLGSLELMWTLDPYIWGDLLPPSWLKATWIDIHNLGIQVMSSSVLPPLLRQGYMFLMDKVLVHDCSKQEVAFSNWCQMYLNVLFISEITSACGQFIHNDLWLCINPRDMKSNYTWPTKKKLSKRAIGAWQKILSKIFLVRTNDRRHREPLGPFCIKDNILGYYSRSAQHVYTHQPNNWIKWTCIHTLWSQNFTHHGYVDAIPNNPVCASGCIKTTELVLTSKWPNPHIESIAQVQTTPSSFLDYITLLSEERQWQARHFKVQGDLRNLTHKIIESK